MILLISDLFDMWHLPGVNYNISEMVDTFFWGFSSWELRTLSLLKTPHNIDAFLYFCDIYILRAAKFRFSFTFCCFMFQANSSSKIVFSSSCYCTQIFQLPFMWYCGKVARNCVWRGQICWLIWPDLGDPDQSPQRALLIQLLEIWTQ